MHVFRYLCDVCILPPLNPLVEESRIGLERSAFGVSERANLDTNQKEEKSDRSRRRVYNERKREAGRGFSCWETHQRSFPKFHSFFSVSKFVLFFTDRIHLIPTVKHFGVQMTAVEQLKHKSESRWLGDLYNRFERRWKKKTEKMGCGNTYWG